MGRLGVLATLAGLLLAAPVCPQDQTPAPAPSTPATAGPDRIRGWRGDGTGRFPEARPVTEWSPEKNVLWQAEVGSSYSSPIVVGERVLLTAEPADLVCVGALDGKVLWRRSNGAADLPPELRPQGAMPAVKTDCGNTAPTPVSDGRNVYVCFNSGVVAAYDLDGNRRWMKYFNLPPPISHGRSASPVLAGGLLLIHLAHLIALAPVTGAVVWEAKGAIATYGTPAVARIGGKEVVVTPQGDIVRVSDGRILASKIAQMAYVTPLVHGDTVYFIDKQSVAVKLPDVMADEIKTKDLWFADLEGEFFASPVCHDGLIHTVSNEANYFVIEAATGKILLEKKPLGPELARPEVNPPASVYAGLVLAGRGLFLFNTAGDGLLLEPSANYRETGRGRLPAGAPGTPAFWGGRMYARGGGTLYCVGAR